MKTNFIHRILMRKLQMNKDQNLLHSVNNDTNPKLIYGGIPTIRSFLTSEPNTAPMKIISKIRRLT